MSVGCGISPAAIPLRGRRMCRPRRTRPGRRSRPRGSRPSRREMEMEPELTLEAVDRDGGIAEALDKLTGGTRADFLRKAVLGGSATCAALATPALAKGRNTAKDIAILRFDLNLGVPPGGHVQRGGAPPPAEAEDSRVGTCGGRERAGTREGHSRAIGKGRRQESQVQLPWRNRGRFRLHRDRGGVRGPDGGAAQDPDGSGRLAPCAGRARVAPFRRGASCGLDPAHRRDRPGRPRLRRADVEGEGGASGRFHEFRHVHPEDEGKAAAQVHGVRRTRRMRRSELGAALALAGVLIGVTVAVVLLEGSADPSSADPELPPSPPSALAPKNVPLGAEPLAFWAPVRESASARVSPTQPQVVADVPRRTPEGTTNIVLVLGHAKRVAGRLWVEVRFPGVPDDARGWVPRSVLGGYTPLRTRLVVDRERPTATLTPGRRGR